MKLNKGILSGAMMAIATLSWGQTSVITGFDNNGMLTWTNASTSLYYSVEWAQSLTTSNTWHTNYSSLTDISPTSGTVTVPVPRFYRVSGSGSRSVYSAPVPKSGQTNSYQSGDDGSYTKGVQWPQQRFSVGTEESSNCVLDNLTGLMWLRNPDDLNRNWSNAIVYCEGLDGSDGRGGFSDWRLPNIQEIRSLIDFGNDHPALPTAHPFIGDCARDYWASTTYYDGNAAFVDMSNGGSDRVGKSEMWLYIWPVRGGND